MVNQVDGDPACCSLFPFEMEAELGEVAASAGSSLLHRRVREGNEEASSIDDPWESSARYSQRSVDSEHALGQAWIGICLITVFLMLVHTLNDPSGSTVMAQPTGRMLQPQTGLEVLVGVMTAPNHFSARQAIRDTWAQFRPEACALTVKFFVGDVTGSEVDIALQHEDALHRDVVRIPGFEDSYHNLSKKTLGMVIWAVEHKFSVLIKADDDSFLHLPRICDTLSHLSPPNLASVYAGVIHRNFPVLANPKSKWYMADQYSEATFPPYAAGPAYVLGNSALHLIYSKRELITPYRVEDAGVSLWLKGMSTHLVDLPAQLYAANCHDEGHDTTYINPVTPTEMYGLFHNARGQGGQGSLCGKGFNSGFCQKFPCLCQPTPVQCTGAEGWTEFEEEPYSDFENTLTNAQT